jgi:hypothetical protein
MRRQSMGARPAVIEIDGADGVRCGGRLRGVADIGIGLGDGNDHHIGEGRIAVIIEATRHSRVVDGAELRRRGGCRGIYRSRGGMEEENALGGDDENGRG